MEVKTGESIWQAKGKCPNLTLVPPHYNVVWFNTVEEAQAAGYVPSKR